MIVELFLGSAALVKGAYKANKSLKMDEEARKKYIKAFERESQARRQVDEAKDATDVSLMKVANRKRAILNTSMSEFLDVYSKIIKINFNEGEGILELEKRKFPKSEIGQVRQASSDSILPMTEKEVISTFLFGGVGGILVKNSERNLAKAKGQLRVSSVVESQAETMVLFLNSLKFRSDEISNLLKKLNVLLIKSLRLSNQIIDVNGYNRANYSKSDRENLMTCINLADALKKVIDTPMLDKDGDITQAAIDALESGSEYLTQLSKI